MGYGNGNKPVAESSRRVVKFKSLYKKAFGTFYTNAAATSGDCAVTCLSRKLKGANGTFAFRKGNPNVVFTSDDRRTVEKFSLRNLTSNSAYRGVHKVTFSA